MTSVVVYMDAPSGSAGQITKQVPGLAIRMTVADEIIEDGLDVFYEILGGSTEIRERIIAGVRELYRATIKVNQDRPEAWRAQVCFNNLTPLRLIPLFEEFLKARFDGERVVLVYEDGLAIFRMDLPKNATKADIDSMTDRLRAAALQSDPRATVRVGDLARELEDWEPLALYQPTK